MTHVSESAPGPLFQAEWLARFHYWSLRAKRAGGSPLLSERPRTLPAGGTEATGVRDYSPGDDLRYVDWNLCARRDEVLTKTFEGAAHLDAAVLLDVSQSMGVCRIDDGGRDALPASKYWLARHIAAASGCWALENLAVFHLVTFSGGVGPSLPPLRGRRHTVQLLRFLEQLPLQDTPTDFPGAVAAFVRIARRPGPVVVISDLINCQGFSKGLGMLRYYGYQPRVVHLYAPEDANPPRLGDRELIDCETGLRQRVTITRPAAARYRQLFEQFLEEVRTYCRRSTMPWLQLRTDTTEEQAIRTVLGIPTAEGQSESVANPASFRP